jgi:hypothetical protein
VTSAAVTAVAAKRTAVQVATSRAHVSGATVGDALDRSMWTFESKKSNQIIKIIK